MKAVCDLHTHSVFSDGTWTPEELVEGAEALGLTAIALTDHNTVAGLPRFLAAAEGKRVEAVPGVEFSTDYRDLDLHVVALDVRPERFPAVTALMEEGVRRKEESNLALAEALNRAGYVFDYAAIRDATPNGQVNRAHIAHVLIEKGYVATMKEAFDTLLEPRCGFYTPPKRPGTFEMIRFIKSIGAIAVLAHPFLKLDEGELRVLLPRAKEAGLDAMETNYVSFDEQTTRTAVALAEEFHLRRSGGSDFHGANKPGIRLGVGYGNLAVPAEFLQILRKTDR